MVSRAQWKAALLVAALLALPARAPTPDPAGWIERREPVVNVTAQWGEALAREPEAKRRRYLAALDESLERALAFAPAAHLFAWPRDPGALAKKRIRVVLDDKPPSDAPAQLLTFGSIATEGEVWTLTYTLYVGNFYSADDPVPNLEIETNGLYGVAQAFLAGSAFFLSTAPARLAELERAGGGEEFTRQFEWRTHAFLTRLLAAVAERPGTLSPPAVRYFTSNLVSLRRRILLSRGEAIPANSLVGRSEEPVRAYLSDALWVGDREAFARDVNRAIAIAGDFMPPGLLDNAFTWDPMNWNWASSVRLEVEIGRSESPNWKLFGQFESGFPEQFAPWLPAFPWTLPMSRAPEAAVAKDELTNKIVVYLPLEAGLVEGAGDSMAWRPHRLARLVALLAGELYGPVSFWLADRQKHGDFNRTFEQLINQFFQARVQAMEILHRILGDEDFCARLAPGEKEGFASVLEELRQWWFRTMHRWPEPGMKCAITLSVS